MRQTLDKPRTDKLQTQKFYNSVNDYESASSIMSPLTKDKNYEPKQASESYSISESNESDSGSSIEDSRDLDYNVEGLRIIGCEELKRLKPNVPQVSSIKLLFSRAVLGRAAFGTVWFEKWSRSPVALKCIKLSYKKKYIIREVLL